MNAPFPKNAKTVKNDNKVLIIPPVAVRETGNPSFSLYSLPEDTALPGLPTPEIPPTEADDNFKSVVVLRLVVVVTSFSIICPAMKKLLLPCSNSTINNTIERERKTILMKNITVTMMRNQK